MTEGTRSSMTCPHCGAVRIYPEERRMPDDKYTCQNCLKLFQPTDRARSKLRDKRNAIGYFVYTR